MHFFFCIIVMSRENVLNGHEKFHNYQNNGFNVKQ